MTMINDIEKRIQENPELFSIRYCHYGAELLSPMFCCLFGKIPSFTELYCEDADIKYEKAFEYINSYLTKAGFDLIQQGEETSVETKPNSMAERKRYIGDYTSTGHLHYVFMHNELEIMVLYNYKKGNLCAAYDIRNKEGEKLLDTMIQTFHDNYVIPIPEDSTISYICRRGNDYCTEDLKINAPKDFHLEKIYNDDFLDVDQNIKRFIQEDRSGLIILHGEQGTGKTTYIRHLISTSDKPFVYLPMDMASYLSDPALISFIKQELSNNIIVIEDCEQLLQDRGDNPYQMNTGLSNILNISDGILGDSLCLKFICTFNNDIRRIDKALLRKGRLIDKYEFGKLTKDKTSALIKEIHDREGDFGEKTLAEIFNLDSDNHGANKKRSSIGF